MADDLIRYDVLVQDALRGVVRKVLREVSETGLPGEHHFYIAFDTTAPGVRMSSRLRNQYPSEMTIVLQHQFWDLAVTEHAMEIGLSFNGIPERLLIPFAAIRGFFDPSVQFGLQFEPSAGEGAAEAGEGAEADETPRGGPPLALPGHGPAGNESEPEETAASGEGEAGEPEAATGEEDEDEDEARTGAEVVSLDAFRKKT